MFFLNVSHQHVQSVCAKPGRSSETQGWLLRGDYGGVLDTTTASPSCGRGAGAGQEGRGALVWGRTPLLQPWRCLAGEWWWTPLQPGGRGWPCGHPPFCWKHSVDAVESCRSWQANVNASSKACQFDETSQRGFITPEWWKYFWKLPFIESSLRKSLIGRVHHFCIIFTLFLVFAESQDGWGWQGPLELIWPNPPCTRNASSSWLPTTMSR